MSGLGSCWPHLVNRKLPVPVDAVRFGLLGVVKVRAGCSEAPFQGGSCKQGAQELTCRHCGQGVHGSVFVRLSYIYTLECCKCLIQGGSCKKGHNFKHMYVLEPLETPTLKVGNWMQHAKWCGALTAILQ